MAGEPGEVVSWRQTFHWAPGVSKEQLADEVEQKTGLIGALRRELANAHKSPILV